MLAKKLSTVQFRTVSVDHLDDIRNDVESLLASGKLDAAFYEENLRRFKYEVPEDMRDAKFIVVASMPQPATMVNFSLKGVQIPAIIPPTYAKREEAMNCIQCELEEAVKPESYQFQRALLPVKTIAARSGLALFGRCNLTFAQGLGSYHRLASFFTDCPDLNDQWQEMRAMNRCGDCEACIKACPTGAITSDRFLIKADRCLANLNEMNSSRPFPDWVEGNWHHCIVGCMRCQNACPENEGKLAWSKDQIDFSDEETEYLLRGEFKGGEAERVEEKLKKIGLDLTIFPRNLQVLLKRLP